MDVVLLCCDVVDAQVEYHRLDQLLDERRGLRPEDVCPQQLARLRIHDEFAEALGIFHGPAVGRGPVLVDSDTIGESGL